MTFRALHGWTFAAIPVLGVLALHTAAALPTAVAAGGLALIAAGVATPEEWRQRIPSSASAAIPLLLAALAALALARGEEPVLVAVAFSVALQTLRVATRHGAQHDPQIVVLAILHLVAAAVLGGTVGFGACLLAFTVIAPGALTLSHLRREVERNYEAGAKDRAGRRVDVERILNSKRVVEPKWLARSLLIAPFVLAFTGVLFLIVPRVGLAIFLMKPAAGTRMIGFSDAVDLGTMGALKANDALAARVEWTPDDGSAPPNLLPFYLRGTAFDSYDGRQWKKTDASAGQAILISRGPADVSVGPRLRQPRELVVRLEPLEPTVLFLPNGTRKLHFEATRDGADEVVVHPGPEDEWRYEAKQPLAIRYVASAESDRTNAVTTLPPEERARYLALPATVDARVSRLATEMIGDAATPTERATRIASALRSTYRYSTDAPSGGQADPLAHFLFTSRAGHCEFFSTALAILLRTQGVPTRNVTGFVGAQRNAFGSYYSVRQQNAHAWVEYWNPLGESAGRWELLDATPASTTTPPLTRGRRFQELYEALAARWDRHVAAFDLADQANLAQRLTNPVERLQRRWTKAARGKGSVLVAAALLPLLALAVWRIARRAPGNKREGLDGKPSPGRHAAADLARDLERTLAAQGTRGSHETLREYVARVCPSEAFAAAAVVVEVYEAARWGSGTLDPTETKKALRHLEEALAGPRGATSA